ncbi:hypothetical protein ACFPJ1_28855 [Kribbella qitaiheensis]|uniref:hypothetical protein n=1 Tax=Kribbella qitaiheensis TaxID=1544730 RepID=UPI00361B4A41
MIAKVADPILVAIVALVGTIVGGLVAGCVQLVVAKMSRSTQVEVLQLQATQEADRVWRDHRRQIYADFLTATTTTMDLIEVYTQAPSDTDTDTESAIPDVHTDSGFPDVQEVRKAMHEFTRAYSDLSLVAGAEMRAVALRVMEMINDSYVAALEGHETPERPADLSHNVVVEAMQKELGLHQAASTPVPSPR